MTQLIVRNMADELKARLKRRAERHGLSMEAEARNILSSVLAEKQQPAVRLGSRMAARFQKVGLQVELPELCGQRAQAADLQE